MDDRRPAGERRDLAGHAVVEAGPEDQEQVALVDRVVGVHAAVHAEHVERQRMVAGQRAQPHHREGHRNAGLRHQRAKLLRRVRRNHAAAGVNHRTPRRADRVGHALISSGLARRWLDAVARQVHRGVVVRDRLGELDVLGQIDEHGPLASGGGHVKGLADHPGHVADVGDEVVVLGDAAADLDDGGLLEGVGADHGGIDLAGDGDHRDAVQLGVGDGGHQIGGPRPAGGHTDPRLSGGSGIALGREPTPLFVAGEDHPDLVAEPGQGLMQWHTGPPWIGKNRIDPVVHQRLDDDIGAASHLRAGRSGGYRRWFTGRRGHVLPSPFRQSFDRNGATHWVRTF